MKAGYKVGRGLFAHARHTGNIIGRIAHKAFKLYHLGRGETVALKKRRFIVIYNFGLAHFGCGKQNPCGIGNKL